MPLHASCRLPATQQVGGVHIAVHVDVRPADLTLRAVLVAPKIAQDNKQVGRINVPVEVQILRALLHRREQERSLCARITHNVTLLPASSARAEQSSGEH